MSIVRFSDALHREPLRPIRTSSAAISMTSLATTNVLNVTGRGVLKSFGFGPQTALTGSPVITFRVQIDGATAMDLLWLNGSLVIHADMISYWSRVGLTSNNSPVTVGNTYLVPLNLPYNISGLVAVIVGTAASAGAIDVSTLIEVPVLPA
jgi:hypothetical protein